MKTKMRIISAILGGIMAVSALSGCGTEKKVDDGKVTISVGGWPEKGTDTYDMKMEQIARFNKKYPDIEIVGDTYQYAVNTFTAKATANKLPTIIPSWFTEVDKVVSAGYVADLTEALDEAGWLDQMNEDIVKYVSKDGKVFGIPWKVYSVGLYINKPLFEQAGLVDESGNVIIPQTYEEVFEAAKTIKEKTGKAGFALPTINNHGGWHAVNMAWAYGTQFLNKSEDGKYTSTLNSSETVAAFEWVKKMRDANVFPDNPNLQTTDIQTLFGAGQVAMYIGEPNYINAMARNCGMKAEDAILASIPEGPNGRMAQMGGDLYFIAKNATPEQIDAALKWIDFTGYGPTLEDETIENLKETYKTRVENGGVVLPREAFYLWTDEERVQRLTDACKEYANIPDSNLENYFAFDGVTLMPEPEVGCQELYAELDKIIQEIYSDSNADVAKLVENASENWQVNCLNNLN